MVPVLSGRMWPAERYSWEGCETPNYYKSREESVRHEVGASHWETEEWEVPGEQATFPNSSEMLKAIIIKMFFLFHSPMKKKIKFLFFVFSLFWIFSHNQVLASRKTDCFSLWGLHISHIGVGVKEQIHVYLCIDMGLRYREEADCLEITDWTFHTGKLCQNPPKSLFCSLFQCAVCKWEKVRYLID